MITSTIVPGGSITKSIAVNEWNDTEAIAFLTAELGDLSRGAEDIVHQLGGNPLALSQVCAVSRVQNTDLLEYAKQYGDALDKALSLGRADDLLAANGLTEKPRLPIATTIEHTLNSLESSEPHAYFVLAVLTVFGSGSVDRARLSTRYLANIDGRLLPPDKNPFNNLAWLLDEPFIADVAGALYRLSELSLIRTVDGSRVMVHAAQRHLMLPRLTERVDVFQVALGSFIQDGGTLIEGVREAQQAGPVLATALDFGMASHALHLMSFEYAEWVHAAGRHGMALRIARAAERWYEQVATHISPSARMMILWQITKWKAVSDLKGDYEQQTLELAALATTLERNDIFAWSLDHLTRLATKDHRSDLASRCHKMLPHNDDLQRFELRTRARFVLAHARLLWLEGDLAGSAKLLTNLLPELQRADVADQNRGVCLEVIEMLAGLARLNTPDTSSDSTHWARQALRQREADHGDAAQETTGHAEALLNLADQCLSAGDLTEAEERLSQARTQIDAHHKDNPRLNGNLALCEGRLLFDKIQLRPGLLTRDMIHSAAKSLTRGIEILRPLPESATPALAAGWFHLGYCYAILGQFDNAREALHEAITLDERRYGPHHPEVQRDRDALIEVKEIERQHHLYAKRFET